MTPMMSKAERRALTWLRWAGFASIDRFGRMVDSNGNANGSQAQTFLRLIIRGYAAVGKRGHLAVTMRGGQALDDDS